MAKSKSTDIIEAEIEDAVEEIEELTNAPQSRHYSEVSEMTDNLHEQTENLVRDKTLPKKEIVSEVSTTDMVIDLALANIAKQTSVKLTKMERFLSKLEDKLYDDAILDNMNKQELMSLYANTRMMRTDAFKMLNEIRKGVDFSALEAQLLSLHSKESMKEGADGGEKMKSMLEGILNNPDFLEQAVKNQKEKLKDEE